MCLHKHKLKVGSIFFSLNFMHTKRKKKLLTCESNNGESAIFMHIFFLYKCWSVFFCVEKKVDQGMEIQWWAQYFFLSNVFVFECACILYIIDRNWCKYWMVCSRNQFFFLCMCIFLSLVHSFSLFVDTERQIVTYFQWNLITYTQCYNLPFASWINLKCT